MRAILVAVNYPELGYDIDVSIEELKELTKACQMEVKCVVTQNLKKVTSQYYIGKGKVDEIKELIEDDDIVIFNEELSPVQLKNLVEELDVEVTDRSDLILRIFEVRAKTREAKLQVKIAKNRYLLPRLIGMKDEIYSQQGGSGFRGSGETQLELDRRVIHRQIIQAKKELEEIVKQRQTQRKARKRKQEKVIALVGYTNSGKSSLLNYFTDKKVFEDDALFASLQTSSRQINLKGKYHAIMSDTVGFINQLPHHLVDAFRSTLEEVKEADLLLHVIDSSSSYSDQQVQTTKAVLQALGVKDTPVIYVYNKIDLKRYPMYPVDQPSIMVSVKEDINMGQLEDMMIEHLYKEYESYEMIIPYDKGDIYQLLKVNYSIDQEEYLDRGIYIVVSLPPQVFMKYQQYEYRMLN